MPGRARALDVIHFDASAPATAPTPSLAFATVRSTPHPTALLSTALLSATLWAALAAPAFAQLGALHAPGGVPYSLDVGSSLTTATGYLWPGVIGCARDANGRVWVTARRTVRHDPNSPHMLFLLDGVGRLLGSWPQPAATANSRWGLRDLAYDGSRFLYAGCEADRIFVFDTQTLAWDPSRAIPVPGNLSFGTMRALAYDPAGNAGAGSLWVANLSSEHVELSLAGAVLRRVPNVQPETYAAAFDPQQRTVWWFGQVGSTYGDFAHVVVTEMDAATGTPTRTRFLGDMSVLAAEYGGFAGGAELRIVGGEPVLLLGVQAFSDLVYEVKARFAFGPSGGGRIGMDGDAAYAGNSAFELTLRNSPNQLATLLIGVAETAVPLPPPSFAANSHVLVELGLPYVFSPFVPVVAGSARMPLAIPQSPAFAGLDLWFQWIEVPLLGGTPTWPIASSDGGKVHITP